MGVLLVASGAGALVVAALVALLSGLHCTSGDGGVPYVARDSAQADVCGATGDGVGLTAVLLIAGLALLPLASRFGRAWAIGERAATAFVVLALAIPALPAGTFVIFAPFSAGCSDEEYEAWSQWNAAGAGGQPPYDCASY